MNFLKKNIVGILILLVIVGIGTCNYKLNTSNQKNLLENPQIGCYYVFKDFPKGNKEAIFKIKEVRDNELVFYVPHSGLLFGFKNNKSEPAIRNLDSKGQMYGSETITISKEEVKRMIANDDLSSAISDNPRIWWAFE